MLNNNSLVDFRKYTAEDMLNSATKNIENINDIIEEMNNMQGIAKDSFLTIYIGLNGGTLKPILISFSVFYDFLKDSCTISEAINKMEQQIE